MGPLHVLAAVHACLAWLLAARVAGVERRFPKVLPAAPSAARVSVVVPARNEAENVGPCLESILAQSQPDLEVLVVDDASQDETAARARRAAGGDRRVRVLHLEGPPPGWAGKAHALDQGSQLAGGEWLLFVDADVRLAPEAVASAIALARNGGYDLLSGPAAQASPTFPWRLVMPVGQQLILTRAAPDGRGRQALAIGHFMLLKRSAYSASGGYARIPASTADDVDLATLLRDSGYRTQAADFGGLLTSGQWSDWPTLWAGWRKSLHGGTGGDWLQLLAGGAAAIAYGAVPLTLTWLGARKPDRAVLALAFAGWLGLAAGRRPFDRQHCAGYGYMALAPLAWFAFGGIMLDAGLRALSGAGSPWKGRTAPGTGSSRRAPGYPRGI